MTRVEARWVTTAEQENNSVLIRIPLTSRGNDALRSDVLPNAQMLS